MKLYLLLKYSREVFSNLSDITIGANLLLLSDFTSWDRFRLMGQLISPGGTLFKTYAWTNKEGIDQLQLSPTQLNYSPLLPHQFFFSRKK